MKRKSRSSIRRRIVLIYFTLVFTAMTAVSVFIDDRIEAYQLGSLRDGVINTVARSNILSSLGNYKDLSEDTAKIQTALDAGWTGSFGSELSVVGKDLAIIASTNHAILGKGAPEVFDSETIAACLLSGEDGESEGENDGIPVKNFCFCIKNAESGEICGAVYVRSDLSGIKSFVGESRKIFIQGIAIALLVTVVLGYVLARNITEPIKSVTETVVKMSGGDFSTEVAVKSDDEIGKLAEMFNLLRKKLDLTLTEISNEKNKLGTILKYMGDGLIAIDSEGKIIQINPAAERMLGLPSGAEKLGYEEVLGHLAKELSAENVKKHPEGGEAALRLGNLVVALRYNSFRDEAGKPVGMVFIMQDITERQKFEDMQTEFVANVSHELKTPLTNIKSYAETLLDGAAADPEVASRFLGIIDSEADRMNRLVRDLLKLTKFDRGGEILDPKEENIISIVDSAVTKLEILAGQKKQSVSRLYDRKADIRVMVERDSFDQVMLNIISNAIKYTGEGGHIDVNVSSDGESARISVKDNGFGIPAASLPRIFERFYRVDKARSRAMGGTGLGLAITKKIVESHMGTITAESREGEGTEMLISLPLVKKTKNGEDEERQETRK